MAMDWLCVCVCVCVCEQSVTEEESASFPFSAALGWAECMGKPQETQRSSGPLSGLQHTGARGFRSDLYTEGLCGAKAATW